MNHITFLIPVVLRTLLSLIVSITVLYILSFLSKLSQKDRAVLNSKPIESKEQYEALYRRIRLEKAVTSHV